MSVRVSVSLSEQHDDFVRGLVAKGEYANASAVIQRAVELLRSETERSCADPDALRDLFRSRAAGEFVSAVEGKKRTEAMLERKRQELGLSTALRSRHLDDARSNRW